MPTKAEIVESLSVGKTDAEIKELEGMTKSELEELSGTSSDDGPKLDETVEGGRYKVGGQIVNADGEKIK